MLDTLNELSACGKPWAERRAKMAIAIAEQYQGGGLEEFEYQDMMQRIIKDDELDREADDLDTKATLVTAVLAEAGVI